jgi:hypothetical protein
MGIENIAGELRIFCNHEVAREDECCPNEAGLGLGARPLERRR